MNVGGVKNKGLIFVTTHIISLAKPLLYCTQALQFDLPQPHPFDPSAPSFLFYLAFSETAISLCLNELLQVARGIDFAQY